MLEYSGLNKKWNNLIYVLSTFLPDYALFFLQMTQSSSIQSSCYVKKNVQPGHLCQHH